MDSDAHIEAAISDLGEAIWRIVRGIECLDLDLISSAREKLDSADKSRLMAIRLRKGEKHDDSGGPG